MMKGGMRKLFLLLFLLLTALAAPKLVVEPDDGVKPLLDLIASAREEILVKMYLWTPSRLDVVDALGEAVARGVKVRVLLEREPAGGRVDLTVFQALKERGVEVKLTTPFRFVFVHEKSLVVDRKLAWVGTMNLTGSSFTANREYALILDDPRQVAEVVKVFEADWEGKRLDLSQALLVWAPSRILGGVKEGNARETLLALIRGAKREVFLEHQAMADPEVVAALQEALARGIRVRLVGSPQEPGDTYFLAGAEELRRAGADLRFLPDPYVHAKALVVDGEVALVGSLNLSANSINANRELAVRFTRKEAPEAFARLLSVMERDFQAGLTENPFALPPLEGIIPWQEAPRYFGRIATVEGLIQQVEDRGTVAFLRFGPGESDLRLVVFPRNYGLFQQPFPQSYLGKKVRAKGRIVLYAGYYEIILEDPSALEVLDGSP
ncbi:DNA-binding protein [Thermus scotoductus]|uniref:phospholipase D n=2 Tax=Thermus scotoductus TaxID=37636 RepID=A0A430QYD3_THESC|nr:DNA-binding protein [Thermus scotoductus]